MFLQCLITLAMGGNGVSRPGGNLGFRGLRFRGCRAGTKGLGPG